MPSSPRTTHALAASARTKGSLALFAQATQGAQSVFLTDGHPCLVRVLGPLGMSGNSGMRVQRRKAGGFPGRRGMDHQADQCPP